MMFVNALIGGLVGLGIGVACALWVKITTPKEKPQVHILPKERPEIGMSIVEFFMDEEELLQMEKQIEKQEEDNL